jgi:hypothetical protein
VNACLVHAIKGLDSTADLFVRLTVGGLLRTRKMSAQGITVQLYVLFLPLCLQHPSPFFSRCSALEGQNTGELMARVRVFDNVLIDGWFVAGAPLCSLFSFHFVLRAVRTELSVATLLHDSSSASSSASSAASSPASCYDLMDLSTLTPTGSVQLSAAFDSTLLPPTPLSPKSAVDSKTAPQQPASSAAAAEQQKQTEADDIPPPPPPIAEEDDAKQSGGSASAAASVATNAGAGVSSAAPAPAAAAAAAPAVVGGLLPAAELVKRGMALARVSSSVSAKQRRPERRMERGLT